MPKRIKHGFKPFQTVRAEDLHHKSEHGEQAAVVQWAATQLVQWPCLRWLYAVPNGGLRDGRTAAMLKREGVTRGISDLCLPFPSGQYHGLYVEMKTDGGAVSGEQAEFIAYCRAVGYYAAVAWGADEAIRVISGYLSLGLSC